MHRSLGGGRAHDMSKAMSMDSMDMEEYYLKGKMYALNACESFDMNLEASTDPKIWISVLRNFIRQAHRANNIPLNCLGHLSGAHLRQTIHNLAKFALHVANSMLLALT